jgi:glycosyltransferase involved in cell wall biosynthesis
MTGEGITRNIPLISVVMCTYNTGEYIAEAIESVLAQSFIDFEFIIWDDGSTDGTRNIVESFKDERIRYFHHENTGLGMALKLACAEARGKYIARMDSDDVCLPERFAKEVDFLETHQDYVLVSTAVNIIDKRGCVQGRIFPCSDDRVLKGILQRPDNMIVHSMVMMRHSAYKKAGGYLPIRKSQDLLFWSRLAKHGKFYNISSPLGLYRELPSSLDHSINPYMPIISKLLLKMVQDDEVIDSDIALYNSIFLYSKQFKQQIKPKKFERGKSREERLFSILKLLIGDKNAESVIVELKNIYYRKRLHI